MNTKANQKKFSKRYSTSNLLLIMSAAILQIASIYTMIAERGRVQFGGEWLLTPMFILLYFVIQEGIRQAKKEFRALISTFRQRKWNDGKNHGKRTTAQVACTSLHSKTRRAQNFRTDQKLKTHPNFGTSQKLRTSQAIRLLRAEHQLVTNSSKQYMHAS